MPDFMLINLIEFRGGDGIKKIKFSWMKIVEKVENVVVYYVIYVDDQ